MDKNIVAKAVMNAKRLMDDPVFDAKVKGYVNEGAGADGYVPSSPRRQPQLTEESYDPLDYTQMESTMINTKLPKNILNSMLNNPINVTPESAGFGSVLEGLDTGELERQTPAPRQRRVLNESAPQQHLVMQPAGIDSNYLKFLVKEAVKECMDEMKKELLNETTVRGFKVGSGNKLMFIDNKGNLYEGEMKLKKRAQQ
mgnify:CR=1 FL=1